MRTKCTHFTQRVFIFINFMIQFIQIMPFYPMNDAQTKRDKQAHPVKSEWISNGKIDFASKCHAKIKDNKNQLSALTAVWWKIGLFRQQWWRYDKFACHSVYFSSFVFCLSHIACQKKTLVQQINELFSFCFRVLSKIQMNVFDMFEMEKKKTPRALTLNLLSNRQAITFKIGH